MGFSLWDINDDGSIEIKENSWNNSRLMCGSPGCFSGSIEKLKAIIKAAEILGANYYVIKYDRDRNDWFELEYQPTEQESNEVKKQRLLRELKDLENVHNI